MNRRVLTFDFGASSGRAMISTFDGEKIELKEIHRFSNDAVTIGDTLYWDTLRLFFEIKQGITKATLDGGFDAIGIDTWGVDFGIIDKSGKLLSNPVHYRDARTEGMMEEVFKIIPKDELYQRTGTQTMRINTLYQLFYLTKKEPELMKIADKILFTPDLFAYFLTGEKKTEATIASTSNMLDPKTGNWDFELLDKLGIDKNLLCDIIQPGETYGMLRESIAEELGCKSVPVIAVATHDTASAVVAVPTDKEDFIYVSCGTWSLFGTELNKPLMSKEASELDITNEGGYGRTIRFLKNIIGLWLFQESCRQWQREGKTIVYRELDDAAEKAAPFKSLINPDFPEFEAYGNLPKRIKDYCKMTNQPVPETDGEIVRCIYESLAFKYRYSLETFKKVTNKNYECIHMVGGGTKAQLLCKFAADACGVTVVTGPIEATAMGNAAVCFIALGDIKDIKDARYVISKSTPLNVFEPENTAEWDEAYERYKKLLEI